MKIAFDTPLTGTDQATGQPITLTADQVAALTFTVFLDTVRPPVKSYQVPAANIAAATTNANGSKHIVVDAVNDLKAAITPGTTYYVAVADVLGAQISPESTVLTYVDSVIPGVPPNFSVS